MTQIKQEVNGGKNEHWNAATYGLPVSACIVLVSQATPSNHCEREGHMRVVSAEFNDYITYYCEILAFAKPSLDGCGFRDVHILAIRTGSFVNNSKNIISRSGGHC